MMIDSFEFENSCLTLYRSYGILNRICWQRRLPACRLYLSTRLSPRTEAYAQDGRTVAEPPRIVFNAETCREVDDTGFLELLAHEMTHIFQFAQGSSGGHGRDFKYEQRRLGLIQGEVISPASPFGYVLFMHELQRIRPAAAACRLAEMRVARAQYSELFARYRSMLER